MFFAEEDPVALHPLNFFQFMVDCPYIDRAKKEQVQQPKYLLPALSPYCPEEAFAQVHMGWHEEGMEWLVEINHPHTQACYPSVELGDSVELFIDTRDVKTSGFNTRFCHHFFFLAEGVDGHFAGELTHFRTEDVHTLCDVTDLKVKSSLKKSSYQMHIFIPGHCLHGYDSSQFKRIGFAYRINRAGNSAQHFSAVTDDFAVEQQPSLWASMRLV